MHNILQINVIDFTVFLKVVRITCYLKLHPITTWPNTY